MKTVDDLKQRLYDLDGRGYPSYKQLTGEWRDEDLDLWLEHAQGDPFATPSRLKIVIPREFHQIPRALWDDPLRGLALGDHLLRVFARATGSRDGARGSGNSGQVHVSEGGAEILERSACEFVDGDLQLRFRAGLPARGRRISADSAVDLLTSRLPRAARKLHWAQLDQRLARQWTEAAEDHADLQRSLEQRDLVAFVANGSILPRESGISHRPMADALAFQSPPSLEVELPTRHAGSLRGMGIPKGVTVITGGGFHGKTTLLEAIQEGIYPHIPGDGRERVATLPGAVKLRSEDGRSVSGVDLRTFITELPGGASTRHFETADASGSTSLAAAILESIEVGAQAILLDEDSAATNLLVRDARMQALVQREPITPLIDRVQALNRARRISTLLVVGGCGDYLDVADTVILMDAYRAQEVTQQAREVTQQLPSQRHRDDDEAILPSSGRYPTSTAFRATLGRGGKLRSRGLNELSIGEEQVDLAAIEQLVDPGQPRAIGAMLRWMARQPTGERTVPELVRAAVERAAETGLHALDACPELTAVRPFELAAALNRMRGLRIETD